MSDQDALEIKSVVEETHAMASIYTTMLGFSTKARTRILDWLVAKLEEDRGLQPPGEPPK